MPSALLAGSEGPRLFSAGIPEETVSITLEDDRFTVLMTSFVAICTGLFGSLAVGGDSTWHNAEFGANVQISALGGTVTGFGGSTGGRSTSVIVKRPPAVGTPSVNTRPLPLAVPAPSWLAARVISPLNRISELT